jgi:hypothetical protein
MFIALAVLPAARSIAADNKVTLPAGQPAGDLSLRQEVQHAIDKGLDWLQTSQGTNGSWSSPDYPAVTGL